jgi:radical SAM protein with 4Fe4S-binding SPASM domain
VKPCGYFDMIVGNVREKPLDKIYMESPELATMRDSEQLKGVCKSCQFNQTCGGCRARAYAVHGDYMAEDPNCDLTAGQYVK